MAKKVSVSELINLVRSSQNFQHILGTTQTNTNYLDSTGKFGYKDVEKTTRGAHCEIVARQAELIIQKLFENEDTRKIIEEKYQKDVSSERQMRKSAYLVGLSHDIGHCLYGHDGEAALNDFMTAQGDQSVVDNFRGQYYGDYDKQQKEQNVLTGYTDSEKKFIFDHGEQSAEAFINICESNGYDINDPLIQEAVQGILFHSRPAFESNSLVVQSVQVSDAIAFIQDDFEQMVAFDKVSQDNAKEMAMAGGVTEKFLNLSGQERKDKIQEEIIKNFKRTGKIQTGQHICDQKWYIDKLVAQIKDGKITLNPDKVKEIKGILDKFGVKLDDSIKLENKDSALKELEIVNKNLEETFKKDFPFYYECRKLHDFVADKLIRQGKIGNNQNEDRAYAQFIISNIQMDIKDIKKDETKIFLNTQRPFNETVQVVFQTPAFKTLKASMETALKQERNNNNSELLRGMQLLRSHNGTELSNEDVLKYAGFNFKDINNAGILDKCTPMQIIAKIAEGLTNSFSRFYAREVVKTTSSERLSGIATPNSDVRDGAVSSNSIKDEQLGSTTKFSAKGLIYLGFTQEQIQKTNKISDQDFIKSAKEVYKEEIIQKLTLRHENPNFDSEKILLKAGIDKNTIESWKKEIISEVETNMGNRSKEIKDTNDLLTDPKGKTVAEIKDKISSIEKEFDKDQTLIIGLSLIELQKYEQLTGEKIVNMEEFKDSKQIIIKLTQISKNLNEESAEIAKLLIKFKELEEKYSKFVQTKGEKLKQLQEQEQKEANKNKQKQDSKDNGKSENKQEIDINLIAAQNNTNQARAMY